MKHNFLWLALLPLSILFTACEKNIEGSVDPSIEIPSEFTTVKFDVGTTGKTVIFTTNQSWEASVDEIGSDDTSWLAVSPDSGDAGEATLTVSVTKLNYTEKERSAYVDITIEGLSKSITVIQEPVTLELPEEVKFEYEETERIVAFEAAGAWTAEIISDNGSWLSVSEKSGEAGVVALNLLAEENYSLSERGAVLEINIGGLGKTIEVVQEPWITEMPDDKAAAMVSSKGFFVANEDWFGWDNGTVNYFKKNGDSYDANYRYYRAANANEADWFGTTTQSGTIWGDNAYFCSKQGNRFVVADAETMRKKAVFETIGGDGRVFVGINDKKGYVSHSKGIVTFDIENLTLGKQIDGVSGQTGNMCFADGRVFAVSQSNGLYVIDAETDEVEKVISGSYNTLTRSKDGDVWVAAANNLLRVDPQTLETEEIGYPDGAKIPGSWGAWNAGGLCASTQNNVLYWTAGGGMFGGSKLVVKYDIDTRTANTSFYALPKSEFDTQLEFYGAGLRVDPLTDELILTLKHSGFGASGAFNWIYKLDAQGNEITNFKVKGDNGVAAGWGGNAEDWDGKYFWFPAVPFFEDANKPQITLNQIILKAGEETVVDLNEKIFDYDNCAVSIQKSIALSDDGMVTATLEDGILKMTAGGKPGSSTCVISVVSNGVRVNKTVRIDIER